jgi:hypothetical protein
LRIDKYKNYDKVISVNIVFTEKTFKTLRNFQDAMAKLFGETAYVGPDSATFLIDYSPELKAMIRPYPPSIHYEFKLAQLSCKDCGENRMFICLPQETHWLCGKCETKRKKSGQPKSLRDGPVAEKAT